MAPCQIVYFSIGSQLFLTSNPKISNSYRFFEHFGGGGKNKVVSHVGILVERLRNSHSLEEVQESLDSLLDLSGANPVEVGEGSLRTVVEQLNSLVENSLSESTGQIIQSLLDIICAVCQITKISTEDQKKAALQRTDDFLENVRIQ